VVGGGSAINAALQSAPGRTTSCDGNSNWNYLKMLTLIHMQTALPVLQIRYSDTSGSDSWTVRATWEDGTFEEIPGFQSEQEADDWITNKFQIWVEEVSKARVG
jgi:hypothetical protein